MRHIDTKKREQDILHLVVESYIEETTPISSGYLCRRYHLPFSSATTRTIMESLERQGLLSNVHTSSGRVPTKMGFKRYVQDLKDEERLKEEPKNFHKEDSFCLQDRQPLTDFFAKALDVIAEISGYTSLIIYDDVFICRGTRFFLEQPEFEDMTKLKALFYALEVRIEALQKVLLENYLEQEMNIIIGDDLGFEDINDCSLVVSGLHFDNHPASLALLGPMRMDYIGAVSSLYSARHQMEEALRRVT